MVLFLSAGEMNFLDGRVAANSLEHKIKAIFIYKFIHFIEWPDSGKSSEEMTIGVLGDSPLWKSLNELKKEEDPNNKIKLMKIGTLSEIKDCEILFVSTSEKSRFQELLVRTEGTPTLTISDTQGFADMGGQINFYLKDGKVRFEINIDSVKKSHLRISSKLLRLAKIVQNSN
jgi:hypothetical protein